MKFLKPDKSLPPLEDSSLPRYCLACQSVIDDSLLIACPRCHTPISTPTQAPTLSEEQIDRLVDRLREPFVDRLTGPLLEKLPKPVTLRIIKNVHWWIVFPLFWTAVLVGSNYTVRGALENLMISRIDREFKEEHIQKTMQHVVNNKAKEMLENEIQPAVDRFRDETTAQGENFQVFLDNLKVDFQKEYQTLSKEISRLKARNYLTLLSDRIISESDTESLTQLERLSEEEQEILVLRQQ